MPLKLILIRDPQGIEVHCPASFEPAAESVAVVVGRTAVGEITDEELHKGQEAKAALEGLLKDSVGARLAPGDDDRDAYGRPLGRLFLTFKTGKAVDVAQYMIQHDHDRNLKTNGEPRR